MDKTQLRYFLDCLVGFRTVGATTEEEVTEPMCAEMRGFITGRLGDLTPIHGHQAMHGAPQAKAMAALLREAADALDALHVANAA
jgi:hypothetical protein